MCVPVMGEYVCHDACVEVIELMGVSSLLPTRGLQEWNSNHPMWLQVPIPTESSCLPKNESIVLHTYFLHPS